MDFINIEQLEMEVKSGEDYLKLKKEAFDKKREYKELGILLLSLSFLIYSFFFISSLQNDFIASIFCITSVLSIYLFICNTNRYFLRLLTKNFIKHSDKSEDIYKKKKALEELKKENENLKIAA